MKLRRLVPVMVVAAFALATASTAFAEATRTWVSGVGDDANPCSRTAPCKTFAGAISKTANGGEINCIDPGGFGAVTITKSITIDCDGTFGSILAAGTTAVIVNGANIVVKLRAIYMNGAGTGVIGVRVINAKSVRLDEVEIYNFTQRGIQWDNTATGAGTLVVKNSTIHDNAGQSVFFSPGTTSSNATFVDTTISGCGAGIVAIGNSASALATVTIRNTTIAENQFRGVVSQANSRFLVESAMIQGNGGGIEAETSGFVRVSNTSIFGNGFGVRATGAPVGQVLSRQNNTLQDNTTDNTFPGTYGPS